jgi:acetamidase/formamidase
MLTYPGAGGVGVAQHGERFACIQPRQLLGTGRRAGAQPHMVGSVDDEVAGGGNLDFLEIGQRVYHPVRVAGRLGADQL